MKKLFKIPVLVALLFLTASIHVYANRVVPIFKKQNSKNAAKSSETYESNKSVIWYVPQGVTNLTLMPLGTNAGMAFTNCQVTQGEKISLSQAEVLPGSSPNARLTPTLSFVFPGIREKQLDSNERGAANGARNNPRQTYALAGINGYLFPANSPVYFFIPTNVESGVGTLAKPYGAVVKSTFDARIQTLPANSTICLLPGIYLTGGMHLPHGSSLIGCGANCTIIRLASLNRTNNVTVEILGVGDNIKVAGLKVDGNWKALAAHHKKMACIVLGGNHDVIEDNWIINFGGDGETSQEGFPVQIGGHDAEIRWNRVTDPQPGASSYVYSSILWIGGVKGSSGKIENNVVIGGDKTPAGFGAVGGDNFDGVQIVGNWFQSLAEGVHGDTWQGKNLTISNNRFINCSRGIGLDFRGTNTLTGVIIENNTFDIPKNQSVIRGGSAIRATGISNISISGNIVRSASGSYLNENVFVVENSRNVVIKDNMVLKK